MNARGRWRGWCLALLCFIPALGLAQATKPAPAAEEVVVVHVFVALCDNQYQGIVPTGKKLGDGQNPDTNLYWGAGYGVRTFFRKKYGWKTLQTDAPTFPVLERTAAQRKVGSKTVILVAEAYDGRNIMDAIEHFLRAGAGEDRRTLSLRDPAGLLPDRTVSLGGAADLVAYVGHNGLMDNPAPSVPARSAAGGPEGAIILACIADAYFKDLLAQAGVAPLVWTTNLMAPEAYSLDAAIVAWAEGKSAKQVREATAAAYDKYQSASLGAARKLFDVKGLTYP